jgi:hypothetical protein
MRSEHPEELARDGVDLQDAAGALIADERVGRRQGLATSCYERQEQAGTCESARAIHRSSPREEVDLFAGGQRQRSGD